MDQRIAASGDAEQLPDIPDISSPHILSRVKIDPDRMIATRDQALRGGMAKTPASAGNKHIHDGK